MIGITGLGPAADYYVMDKSQKVDEVVAEFERLIMLGYHPNDVEQQVYRKVGVNPAIFTSSDKAYIVKAVERAYKSQN